MTSEDKRQLPDTCICYLLRFDAVHQRYKGNVRVPLRYTIGNIITCGDDREP